MLHKASANKAIGIVASGIYVPKQRVTTKAITEHISPYIDEKTLNAINNIGVVERYSIVKDYPEYLADSRSRHLIDDTLSLAVKATNNCLEDKKNKKNIGLLISITNSANRPLPCLGYELINDTNLPKSINIINMQRQGCSVLLKAVALAYDYINCHPNKSVLIVASEGHTGFAKTSLKHHPINTNKINTKTTEDKVQIKAFLTLLESILFGDGAVALLLANSKQTKITFQKIMHLTNIEKQHTEILKALLSTLLNTVSCVFWVSAVIY